MRKTRLLLANGDALCHRQTSSQIKMVVMRWRTIKHPMVLSYNNYVDELRVRKKSKPSCYKWACAFASPLLLSRLDHSSIWGGSHQKHKLRYVQVSLILLQLYLNHTWPYTGTVNKQPIATATFCGINLAALAHIKSTPIEEQRLWSYSTSHKRGYEGESDSDDQEFVPRTPTSEGDNGYTAIPTDYFNIDFDDMDQVSPTTQPNDPMISHMMGRRLAKPKSKKRQSTELKQSTTHNPFTQLHLPQQLNSIQWMGRNRATSCGIEAIQASSHFSNATFLQRREDVDMDCSWKLLRPFWISMYLYILFVYVGVFGFWLIVTINSMLIWLKSHLWETSHVWRLAKHYGYKSPINLLGLELWK